MPVPTMHTDELLKDYLVARNLPTIWCSGCGIGTAVGAVMQAIHRLNLDRKSVAFTIGIGCSGYTSRYLNFDVAHTTHGRALAVATGMKMAKPSLKVITLMGDGDCLAIGGNHFIHAARRNIDVTAIVMNNSIYGMTGGQYSPATPFGAYSTTSPYGMVEGQMDACELARAAGATYVARSTAYHVHHLIDVLAEAIMHPGFSLVEAYVQCPNQFGRMNKSGTASDMMQEFKEKTYRVDTAQTRKAMERGERFEGKTPIGVLHKGMREEYTAEYQKVQEMAHKRVLARR